MAVLIHRLIGLRDACGATTDLSWVKAHSDIASLVHIGNRCADELAKRASALRPSAAVANSSCTLPLEQEEVWLALREWDSDSDVAGRLVTSDPRRHCFRRMEEVAAQEWAQSDTQSRFASADVDGRALWLSLRHPRFCGAVLRFLTDTAHWHRPPEGGACERQCRNCRTSLTISISFSARRCSAGALTLLGR